MSPNQMQGATSGFSFGVHTTAGTAAAPTAFGTSAQTPAFGAGRTTVFVSTQRGAAPTFGTPATSNAPTFSATTFSFGAPTSGPPAASETTSFGFGTQTAASSVAATTLNFAATASTSVPSMGLGGRLGSSLGGNFLLMKPAATASASIHFGTTTITSLGGQPAAGSLFGKAPITTSAAPVTALTPFVGLRGVDDSANKPKDGDNKQDITG